jgi:lysophospholipase L1-like esterase
MPPALPSADRQKTLEQVQLVLRRARRDANQAGAHFLLAFVPTKLRVLRGLMTIPSNSDLVSRRPLDDLPEQLGVWARQHDIPYLDLTPTLISAAQSGELVYLADDGHWSASGHRVVAERVGAALEPWLDSDSSP